MAENADNPGTGAGGRPPFVPTEKMRGEVQAFSIAGYTQEQIAEYLDIDPKTLRANFRTELDFASMKVIANAAMNVVRLGNGVPAEFDDKGNKIREEIPMSLGPNAFILKTRGKKQGWSERLELTGKNGEPLMPDLSGVSDDKLKILEQAELILNELAAAGSGTTGTGKTTH